MFSSGWLKLLNPVKAVWRYLGLLAGFVFFSFQLNLSLNKWWQCLFFTWDPLWFKFSRSKVKRGWLKSRISSSDGFINWKEVFRCSACSDQQRAAERRAGATGSCLVSGLARDSLNPAPHLCLMNSSLKHLVKAPPEKKKKEKKKERKRSPEAQLADLTEMVFHSSKLPERSSGEPELTRKPGPPLDNKGKSRRCAGI